jgi:nucleoside-diphosphate-sugar epimerase
MAGRLFIFGLGYSGLQIARLARAAGWQIAGTCTSQEKASALRDGGITAHRFDGAAAPPADLLADATHVISTIAPGDGGDPVLRTCRNLLGRVRWFGYLSTTGVYGDHGGSWVEETTPARPTQPRSIARLAAERSWQALALEVGINLDIFRLPGIYGPGRSAIEQVAAGTVRRIDKPGQVFSRIHVEDIAGTVLIAITQPHAGSIYNVADDLPASTADVVAYACELLGKPVPPLVPWLEAQAAMSPMAQSFYAENRRVRNERIKDELGVVLRYPTYREGLRAIASSLAGPRTSQGGDYSARVRL